MGEHIYAKKFGLYPESTNVTGPSTFAACKSSCLEAQASAMGDREKLLKAILCESDVESTDKQIAEFRRFGSRSSSSSSALAQWLDCFLPCFQWCHNSARPA